MRHLLLVLTVLLAAGQVFAGAVRGVVQLDDTQPSNPVWKDGCFWRLGAGQAPPYDSNPPVVVLEGERASEVAPSREFPTVQIEGYGLWPAMVWVAAESSVTFKNLDDHPYSCSAAGSNGFSFSDLEPGETHEQRFMSEGKVDVRCHRYPFMQFTILVLRSPLVTAVDNDGKFTIEQVPAGNYQARVFTGGSWRWSRDIKVPAYGAVQVALGPKFMEAPPPLKSAGLAEEEPPPPEKKESPPGVEKRIAPVASTLAEEEEPPPEIKKPAMQKKAPAKKKRPKKTEEDEEEVEEVEEAEPAFKNVEPEIEIEEE